MRLFGTPLKQFREWHRVGYVPQRATAASGVPATVREVVSSGRLSRAAAVPPLSAADRAAVRRRARARRHGRPQRRTPWRTSPAASTSGC